MEHDKLTPESILALRRRLNLSQSAFAALLNARVPGLRTHQVTVARWERARCTPSGVVAAIIRRIIAETIG